MVRIGTLFFISFLLTPFPVEAQGRQENPKVRLAQSYEAAGKFEDAVALYEELRSTDSSNIVFFEGLRRCYMQLKRYDDAIGLLNQRITTTPGDVNMRAQLGSVLYKAGREAEASAAWDTAIAIDSLNPASYRAVAAVLTENRLLDQTAGVYRRARRS